MIRNFSNEKESQYDLSSFRYEIAKKFLETQQVQKAIIIAPQKYWYQRAFDKDYSIFLFQNGEIDNALNVIKYLKKEYANEYYEHLIGLSNLSAKIKQKELGKKLIRQVEKYLNSFDKESDDASTLDKISKLQKLVSLFYFVNNNEKKGLKIMSNIKYGFWKCSAKIEIAQHLFLMNRIDEAQKMIELSFKDLLLISDVHYLRILMKEIRITELLISKTIINQKYGLYNFSDTEILIGLGKKLIQYFSKDDFHNFIRSKFSIDQQKYLVQGYYFSHLLIDFSNSELLLILKDIEHSTHLIKKVISCYFINNYFIQNKSLGLNDEVFIQTLNLQWAIDLKKELDQLPN